ncbi:MAG: ATP-binding protein, partial [Leptospiraceae bacterium]|nr:ATP-binding protein [Leptospiraceae bacterium]
VHSLKGNARALNLESIGERAHKLEDELDKLRSNVSEIQKEFIERTLKALEEFHIEIKDGSSIFEKILGMKSALGGKQKDVDSPAKELEDFLRSLLNKESKELGKQIDFHFFQEGDEVSGELLGKLKNPLIQILKNSLDHGIESSENRVKLGKKAQGKISVRLQSSGGKLIIDCEDDGGGLNLERIKKKAIEVGVLKEENVSKMSREEIYQLIFRAGFSTADKVTGLSGRGVGMDIVKDDIEKLGGKIRIQTHEGKFTKFSIEIRK